MTTRAAVDAAHPSVRIKIKILSRNGPWCPLLPHVAGLRLGVLRMPGRGLRDPARLRPWLYAVARNECMRRLRTGIVTATLDEAAALPADIETADPVVRAERADLVSASSALAGA